jgi:hypothetical protein
LQTAAICKAFHLQEKLIGFLFAVSNNSNKIIAVLPEFPKARRKMLDLWNTAFFSGMNGSDAFLSQIPVRAQKEGDAAQIGSDDMDYKLCSVKFSFPARDAQGMTEEEFFGAPLSLGAQMAGQQAKTVYSKLMTPSPHGMPLEWKIGELQFDQLLAIWEKMEVDFGNDGLPRWPTIVLHPEARAEVMAKLPQWHEDPECRKKWAALVLQKRKEFDERETRRRLVD